jgi:hypothetical protein
MLIAIEQARLLDSISFGRCVRDSLQVSYTDSGFQGAKSSFRRMIGAATEQSSLQAMN